MKTAFLMASLCSCCIAATENQSDVKSETLLRTTSAWNGVAYRAYPKGVPEISLLKITIPAHTKMKWHTHPMPNVAYIVSGEITVEEPDGKTKRHFVSGQAVPETVNTLHRGVTGDQPVELIVFYAGVKGMPLAEVKR